MSLEDADAQLFKVTNMQNKKITRLLTYVPALILVIFFFVQVAIFSTR